MPADGVNWLGLLTGGGAAGAIIVALVVVFRFWGDREKAAAERDEAARGVQAARDKADREAQAARDKAAQEDARLAREAMQVLVNGVLASSREQAAASVKQAEAGTSMAASLASMAATLGGHTRTVDGHTKAVEGHTRAVDEMREQLIRGSGHALPVSGLPEPPRQGRGGK